MLGKLLRSEVTFHDMLGDLLTLMVIAANESKELSAQEIADEINRWIREDVKISALQLVNAADFVDEKVAAKRARLQNAQEPQTH